MTYPGIENDKTEIAANPDRLAVEQLRKEREEEFAEWVAAQDIPWGNVLAATPGMAIPKSTVERLKWDELGLVVKRSSKEGRALLEQHGGTTPADLERWAKEDKPAAKADAKPANPTSPKTEG